ncbi:MAG TPA: NUDIX domain-containing protein [Bacteroidales bacterium]|nr:NUDIX domain-containing protein [Bacteroidales bacterium]
MTKVSFYDPDYDPATVLTYSVICARYKDQWVYVRNRLRTTYEIPGGHIEAGESSDQAAKRELMEETGAIKFEITRIATYSVDIDGQTGWGRVYYAIINEIGPVPDNSEIGEVIFLNGFPEDNTHPHIQPHLFRKVNEYLEGIK